MFLNGYPYSDFHELNLDFLLKSMDELKKAFKNFTASNSLIFAEPLLHDLTKNYAKNTIVLDPDGNAYISLQIVPEGVQLSNTDYWIMVFDFQGYVERANKNFTNNYFSDINRAPYALAVNDWVVLDDVLYKVTQAIATDELFVIGTNLVHFTIEQFLKDFVSSVTQTLNDWHTEMTNTINQYKNDIDASELLYKQQIDQSELEFTTNLQNQFDQVLAGATVDSEVINARIGIDVTTHATLGNAIREQLLEVEEGSLIGLEAISSRNTDFIDYAFQFIDNSGNVADEIWQSIGGVTPYDVSATGYHRILPFMLTPGTYTIGPNDIFASQSFIEDSNGVTKFSVKYNTGSTYTGDFTITENTMMYLSTTLSWSEIILFNKNNLITATQAMNQRKYYYLHLNSNVLVDPDQNDTSKYDQFFIKGCELTSNNDHLNANTSVAKYVRTDMGADIKTVLCRAKFRKIDNNTSVTLIATKRHTNAHVQDIVQDSIHIGFGPTGASIQTMSGGTLTTLQTYSYTISANTEYLFGWKLVGDTVTMYLPDGTTQTYTDATIAPHNGHYIIFETFSYQTAATNPPTDNYDQPVITGFFCNASDGFYLKDNFKRPDGGLTVSPTGHVYECFRNASSTDNQYFDNAG